MWGLYMKKRTDFEKLEIFYNEYIEKITKLIKVFDNLDMYQQILLYDNLLYCGLLSATNTFEYHDYIIDKDHNSILGARITNGNGVCRHMASNQQDVFNQLGYQTVDISCFTKCPQKFQNAPILYFIAQLLFPRKHPFDAHAISGLFSDKKYLIYSPTGSSFCFKKINKKFQMIEPACICRKPKEHIFSDIENFIDHPKEYAKFKELLKLPNYFETKSIEELNEIYTQSNIDFSLSYGYFQKWKEENLDLMNEIRILDKNLSRYSDQPTRKLIR